GYNRKVLCGSRPSSSKTQRMCPHADNRGLSAFDERAFAPARARATRPGVLTSVGVYQISLVVPQMDGSVLVSGSRKIGAHLSDTVTALVNFAPQTFEDFWPRRRLSAFRGKYFGIHRV